MQLEILSVSYISILIKITVTACWPLCVSWLLIKVRGEIVIQILSLSDCKRGFDLVCVTARECQTITSILTCHHHRLHDHTDIYWQKDVAASRATSEFLLVTCKLLVLLYIFILSLFCQEVPLRSRCLLQKRHEWAAVQNNNMVKYNL